jgi:hypothetical protein
VLPAAGLTLAELLQLVRESLKLPTDAEGAALAAASTSLKPAYFICTSGGIALLDTTSRVDQFHVAEGLRVCDGDELLQVTINDSFAVGFSKSSKPRIMTLIDTMGLATATPICRGWAVQDPAAPLLPDAQYHVVTLPSEDYRPVCITYLPASSAAATYDLNITVHASCTVGDLL